MKRRTKPTRSARAALAVLLLTTPVGLFAQGLNNLWMGGYASWAGPPYGGVDIDFSSGSMVVSAVSRDIGFFRTNTNITDASGEVIFSTNGTFVANALGDTMLNGGGLNPGPYTASYPDGISIPQGALILPKPETPGIYWLLHLTVDNQVGLFAEQLYLTTIDMSLDGGLGGVVSKNQIILTDDLNVGRLTAVRHANGRDWWAFCHKINTDIYYRLLVTPSGISLDGTQSIGVIRNADAGQVCFSPDGSKFAYYWGEPGEDLDLFQFDRCTGLFYDPVYVPITDYDGGIGVAFSPNSRFVYVSSIFDVYQFDTEAADIAASMVHIAEWDSTYSPFPPFATLFDIAQLAPDGKVHISTGNGTDKLHVIHAPDSAGLACNIEQHGIALPRYFSNSLPNHPNYHLGALAGSPCDTLGLSVGEGEWPPEAGLKVFPNPGNGQFTLSYPAQSTAGSLGVRDLQGRLVHQGYIAPWSQVHNLVLRGAAAGMYHCSLRWGSKAATVRIILEP